MPNHKIESYITPSGEYRLSRIPNSAHGSLRAWDAADELIINTLFKDYSENPALTDDARILILNDTFGALTLALHEFPIDNWSDSYLSHLATEENFRANNCALDSTKITLIPSTDELHTQYPLVLIKIPKTLSLLEDQLCRLKPHLAKKPTIIAAAMSKHIHTSTLTLFEKIIGTTSTSLAKKKARLIFVKNDKERNQKSPYPKIIEDNETNLILFNYANVFAKDKLDIGTRLFIQNMHLCPPANHIIDLGCGNGALGIIAKRLQPKAKISFVDESYNAIASAKKSYTKMFNDHQTKDASFHLDHALSHFKANGTQLVLCNPPFHQAHSIDDQIAWDMFTQSRDVLDKSGEIRVIGNRHLAYHSKLKKIFGNCKTVAGNNKFVILAAKKL